MTLDEAIKHCEEVAEKYCEKVEEGLTADDFCDSCASEHRQLAEWLRKLKAYEDAREELEQKMNSGQWSDAVIYGMQKALLIQNRHFEEVKADD